MIKRIFTTAAAVCCLAAATAAQGPMTLRGVTLDLDMDEFVRRMDEKGVRGETAGTVAFLRGSCFGFRNAGVVVIGDDVAGGIRTVTVDAALYEGHATALFEFRELTRQMKDVYGKPFVEGQERGSGLWTAFRATDGIVNFYLREVEEGLWQIRIRLENSRR